MMQKPLVCFAMLASLITPALAAEYPTPKSADWIAKDFKFHTGETLPELKLHYTTIGDPAGAPVLILHGTAGSGDSMLTPAFAGNLFGPGQALDAKTHFIILPDAIGTGQSSRPSEGLRAKFPVYNYADMVQAQYRLVTEGLGLRHLSVVLGNSMGGMQTWLWGTTYPDFMDALVPMASQPTEMASRNWMLRRMLVESIKRDPAYNNGNYTTQPPSLAVANVFFGIATNGGTLAYQSLAPTGEKADKIIDERLAAGLRDDANDFIYQWQSSRDYNPAPYLDRIKARTLVINAADDERNPPETGVLIEALKKVKNAQLYVIPASPDTRGHGTTSNAAFWQQQLKAFLAGT